MKVYALQDIVSVTLASSSSSPSASSSIDKCLFYLKLSSKVGGKTHELRAENEEEAVRWVNTFNQLLQHVNSLAPSSSTSSSSSSSGSSHPSSSIMLQKEGSYLRLPFTSSSAADEEEEDVLGVDPPPFSSTSGKRRKSELYPDHILPPSPETIVDLDFFSLSVSVELSGTGVEKMNLLVVALAPIDHEGGAGAGVGGGVGGEEGTVRTGSLPLPAPPLPASSPPPLPPAPNSHHLAPSSNLPDLSDREAPSSGDLGFASPSSLPFTIITSPPSASSITRSASPSALDSDLQLLLSCAFSSPTFLSFLLTFSRSLFLDEHLLFLSDLARFKQLFSSSSSSSSSTSSPSSPLFHAWSLYSSYIRRGAEHELLSSDTARLSIESSLEEEKVERGMFEEIEKESLRSLKEELMPKVIEKYGGIQEVLKTHGGGGGASPAFTPPPLLSSGSFSSLLPAGPSSASSSSDPSVIPAYTKKITGKASSGLGVATSSRCSSSALLEGWEEVCRTEVLSRAGGGTQPAHSPSAAPAYTPSSLLPPPATSLNLDLHSMEKTLASLQVEARHIEEQQSLVPAETNRSFRCLIDVPVSPSSCAHVERRVRSLNNIGRKGKRISQIQDAEFAWRKSIAGEGPPPSSSSSSSSASSNCCCC